MKMVVNFNMFIILMILLVLVMPCALAQDGGDRSHYPPELLRMRFYNKTDSVNYTPTVLLKPRIYSPNEIGNIFHLHRNLTLVGDTTSEDSRDSNDLYKKNESLTLEGSLASVFDCKQFQMPVFNIFSFSKSEDICPTIRLYNSATRSELFEGMFLRYTGNYTWKGEQKINNNNNNNNDDDDDDYGEIILINDRDLWELRLHVKGTTSTIGFMALRKPSLNNRAPPMPIFPYYSPNDSTWSWVMFNDFENYWESDSSLVLSCHDSSMAPVVVSFSNIIFRNCAQRALAAAGNVHVNVKNCIFENNVILSGNDEARSSGGSVFIGGKDSKIIILDSLFRENSAFPYETSMVWQDFFHVDSFRPSLLVEIDKISGLGHGGALAVYFGATIFTNNTSFVSNIAICGGAVKISGGKTKETCQEGCVVFKYSFFLKNTAAIAGGGCAVKGMKSLFLFSTFSYNTGSKGGGGLFLEDTEITIFQKTNIFKNRAKLLQGMEDVPFDTSNSYISQKGGGILAYGPSNMVFVSSANIQFNSAYGDGGGLSILNHSSLILEESLLENNVAMYGGGLSVQNGNAVILSTTLFYNKAQSGGAINAYSKGFVFVDHSELHGNTAKFHGGGIFCGGRVNMNIKSSSLLINSGLYGGGLFSDNATLNVGKNTTFGSNVARFGGAVTLRGATKANFSDTLFSANSADSKDNFHCEGGAIWAGDNVTMNMKNCTVRGNFALGSGGGLLGSHNVSLAIYNSSFENNKVTKYGGALVMSLNHHNRFSFVGGNVTNNVAKLDYPGVLLTNWGNRTEIEPNASLSMLEIRGVLFAKNNIDQRVGHGALSVIQLDHFDIRIVRCRFEENVAGNGAGVYLNGVHASINDTLFKGNSASNLGAGLLIERKSQVYLTDVTFDSNCADKSRTTIGVHGGGGMAALGGSRIMARDVTWIKNVAVFGGGAFVEFGSFLIDTRGSWLSNAAYSCGGAIHVRHGCTTMYDSVFRGNSANRTGGAIFFEDNPLTRIDEMHFNSSPLDFRYFFNADKMPSLSGKNLASEKDMDSLKFASIPAPRVHTFPLSQEPEPPNSASTDVIASALQNCTFSFNSALDGGAIKVVSDSFIEISNSCFIHNVAGRSGGAIKIGEDSDNGIGVNSKVSLLNVTAVNNLARHDGGFLNLRSGFLHMYKCNMTANIVQFRNIRGFGGAISMYVPAGNVTSCLFDRNEAYYGGAVYMAQFKNENVDKIDNMRNFLNCTFVRNSAHVGGGVYQWYPSAYSFPSINHMNNSAIIYGSSAATQAWEITWKQSKTTDSDISNIKHLKISTFSGDGILGDRTAIVRDFYGNQCHGMYSTIEVTSKNNNGSSVKNIDGFEMTLKSLPLVVLSGEIEIKSSIELIAAPGVYNITFRISPSPLLDYTNFVTDDLTSNVTVTIKDCRNSKYRYLVTSLSDDYFFLDLNTDVVIGMCLPIKRASNVARYTLRGIAASSLIFCIFISAFMYKYRDAPALKAGSVRLLQVVLLGCILAFITVVTLSIEHLTRELCLTNLWLGHLAFALTFSTLLAKSYRIHIIFNCASSRLVVSRKLTDRVLLWRVAFFTVLGFSTYLLVWTLIDSKEKCIVVVRTNTILHVVHQCCSKGDYWGPLLYGIEGIMLFAGCCMAFKIRNIPRSYNDSRVIASSIYTSTVGALLLLLMKTAKVNNPTVQLIMLGFIILLVGLTMLILLFIPKILEVLWPRNRDEETCSPGNATGTIPRRRRTGGVSISQSDADTIAVSASASNIYIPSSPLFPTIGPNDCNNDDGNTNNNDNTVIALTTENNTYDSVTNSDCEDMIFVNPLISITITSAAEHSVDTSADTII